MNSQKSQCKTEDNSQYDNPSPKYPLLTQQSSRYKNLVHCFKCSIDDCEMLFETPTALKEHSLIHTNLFQCPVITCGLQFQKSENLFKHQKTHLPSRKIFLCPYPNCNRRFTATYNLKIHYRVHTGEKPYTCMLCMKSFFDRANFKYHQKVAHLIKKDNEVICQHCKDNHRFKTKKQKIMHHNKLQDECRNEKNFLLNLLNAYKNATDELIDKFNCSENIKQSFEYKTIDIQKRKLEKSVFDMEQYEALFLKKDVCKFK